jgi:hypothetical protein
MSWFWMAFFLILSAVAVGIPFILPSPGAGEGSEPAGEGSSLRRLRSALRELELDLSTGKMSAQDHALARAGLEEELRVLQGGSPGQAGPGGAGY